MLLDFQCSEDIDSRWPPGEGELAFFTGVTTGRPSMVEGHMYKSVWAAYI